MVTKEQIIKWLELAVHVMQDNKEWLTQLDAAVGDGEHGINMACDFQKVSSHLPSVADKDIGSILKRIGTIILQKLSLTERRVWMTIEKLNECTFFVLKITLRLSYLELQSAIDTLRFRSLIYPSTPGTYKTIRV
jgi:hypothetical protein